MISTPNRRVEEHYADLERRWPVHDGQNDYGRLVVPTGNAEQAVHRWFHLKEAFSHGLLFRIFKDLEMSFVGTPRILDCYAGSGTVLASAADLASAEGKSIYVRGIERNPFLHLVSYIKSTAAQANSAELTTRLRKALPQIKARYRSALMDVHSIPVQATWQNDQYFPGNRRHELLSLRRALDDFADEEVADLLLFAAATSVEACTRLRKDGRALRFEPYRVVKEPWSGFERRVTMIADDLSNRASSDADLAVAHGDGRFPQDCFPDEVEPFDLIIFSPPYPNNIDYTEVYKLEGWFLGAYGCDDDFRSQRLATVRSHSSILYDDTYRFNQLPCRQHVEGLVDPILRAVPPDRYLRARTRMIKGYADDMLSTLTSCRKLIRDSGSLVFVVGNSVHGTIEPFAIAADLLMARLGELCGWHVQEIRPARYPRRRRIESAFVRESVVVLKPSAHWSA